MRLCPERATMPNRGMNPKSSRVAEPLRRLTARPRRTVCEVQLAGKPDPKPGFKGRFACFLVLMAPIMSTSTGCGIVDPCLNGVISRVKSPDGAKEAIVFQRSCEAPAGSSTQLSVVPAGSPFLELPTTWSATEGGNAAASQGTFSELGISVRWVANNRLVVFRPAGSRALKAEQTVDGVTLEYQETPRSNRSQP